MQSMSARLDDFWRLKLARTTKDDILIRCKFLLRRCKFYEICDEAAARSHGGEEESPYMQALLYLQTELAQVADSSSQTEFLACMGYLLASDKPKSPSEDHQSENTTASYTDPSGRLTSATHREEVNRRVWSRRTSVFEDILGFFPEDCVQPNDDLVSCTSAWQSLL